MLPPRVYLDENVDFGLVAELMRRGFFVTHAVLEQTQSFTDEAQITYANQQGLTIVSHNLKHFCMEHRKFVQNGWSHEGIILIPTSATLRHLSLRVAMMLAWIVTRATPTTHRLYEWGDLQYELTRGFTLPGFTRTDFDIALGRQP